MSHSQWSTNLSIMVVSLHCENAKFDCLIEVFCYFFQVSLQLTFIKNIAHDSLSDWGIVTHVEFHCSRPSL